MDQVHLFRAGGNWQLKDPERKAFLIVLFIGLVCVGFLGTKMIRQGFSGEKPPSKNSNLGQSLPPRIVEVEPEQVMYHKYGRPVKGPLLWERDRRFHEICARYNVAVRMAAFQTTLPDPLPGEEYNVALAADLLAGTVVPAGKVFSTNQTIGPYNSRRGFREGPVYIGTQVSKNIGGGVCKISTTLYNVATLANLQIIERNSHGMLVPYVPPGQDATVSEGSKDFRFKNNTAHPIVIWADTKENTLYMAVYGRIKPPEVTWHHRILNRQLMPTIYRYNKSLKAGEEKIIIPGADGVVVKNWLTIKDHNGVITRKELGIDYYRPMIRVIERGNPN